MIQEIKTPLMVEHHAFERKQLYFIFEILTSNIYHVDELTYKIASFCDGSNIEKIYDSVIRELNISYNEFCEVLTELKELSLIYNKKDIPTNYSSFNPEIMPKNLPVYALALHLVDDCNLRCTYCYGDGGSYGHKRLPMTKKVALQSIDFLMRQKQDCEKFSIIFFGGEPLVNFKLIKEVAEYCKQMEKKHNVEINMGMTTNGVLLTSEIQDFLDEYSISVGVSIDGDEETHDSCRKCIDGSGSFQKILPNVKEIIKRRGGRVTGRITLTKNNLNMYDIMAYVESLGFRKVNVALVSADRSSPLAIQPKDYQKISEEYEKLSEKIYDSIKNRNRFYVNIFTSHLQILHEKSKLLFNCGAGRKYMAVSPSGNLYLCHRFAGDEEYNLGNVFTGIDYEKRAETYNAHVDARDDCKTCWARYICGGGCFHNSFVNNGTLTSSPDEYCKSYKELYEMAIHLYWRINELDPSIMDSLFKPIGENYFDMDDKC